MNNKLGVLLWVCWIPFALLGYIIYLVSKIIMILGFWLMRLPKERNILINDFLGVRTLEDKF